MRFKNQTVVDDFVSGDVHRNKNVRRASFYLVEKLGADARCICWDKPMTLGVVRFLGTEVPVARCDKNKRWFSIGFGKDYTA